MNQSVADLKPLRVYRDYTVPEEIEEQLGTITAARPHPYMPAVYIVTLGGTETIATDDFLDWVYWNWRALLKEGMGDDSDTGGALSCTSNDSMGA